MSFSYDTSLSTFKDKVRLLVSDTTQSSAAFSDEEIAAWESVQPNIYLAAADFCQSKGLKIAERAYSYDTSADLRGGLSVDRRNQPKWWFDQAKKLTEIAVTAGVDEIYEHVAFNVDVNGVDCSEYQGQTISACDL